MTTGNVASRLEPLAIGTGTVVINAENDRPPPGREQRGHTTPAPQGTGTISVPGGGKGAASTGVSLDVAVVTNERRTRRT